MIALSPSHTPYWPYPLLIIKVSVMLIQNHHSSRDCLDLESLTVARLDRFSKM